MSNERPLINPILRLQEPIEMSGDTSMRDTPDVSTDIDQRLIIDTSEEDDLDSLLTDESSIEEESVQPQPHGLSVSQLPTGLCYDPRMRFHAEVAATTAENVHPEDPRRIYYIFKELCNAGLIEAKDGGKAPIVERPLLRIDAREATRDECCLVHTEAHYDFVEQTSQLPNERLIDLSEELDSIYFNQLSYYSSKLSAGAAIETCRAVFSRKVKNAIAVIRPPGHHAEVESTMGFCLFNNVCIASKVCQADFGEDCKKILIVDWDVHHGNGCQKAFYDDPNILYISLHVHMNGMFYPSGNDGDMFHVGEGEGLGMNVNIPWPTKGMGDGDYIYAFENVVMPIATEFDPDFVIVASGFDAAAGDELGGCFVTPPAYAHMTHMLMRLAGGKIAVCLEGGYNFSAISKSALAVTRTLMGEPPDRLQTTSPSQSAVDTVQKVRQVQAQFWKTLYPKDPFPEFYGGERLHDILRQWQARFLYDRYKLTQLHILRENISKSFDQQVLATPLYETKKHLLVIFHDAPDLVGPGGSLSTLQKPHETLMIDGTQSYIAWGVEHDFGIIDVNIPEFVTVPDLINGENRFTEIEYSSATSDLARKEGEKLALYLWDNYIEPYDFDGGIFLMGCGHAFHAVAKLVSENENVYQSLLGVVGFIANQPVRPIGSQTNHWVGQWYRENSLVFVCKTHSLWKKEGKVSKRFGKLLRSEGSMLNEMMRDHEEDVFSWFREKAQLEEEEETGDTESEDDTDRMKEEFDQSGSSFAPDIDVKPTMGLSDDVFMSTERQ